MIFRGDGSLRPFPKIELTLTATGLVERRDGDPRTFTFPADGSRLYVPVQLGDLACKAALTSGPALSSSWDEGTSLSAEMVLVPQQFPSMVHLLTLLTGSGSAPC